MEVGRKQSCEEVEFEDLLSNFERLVTLDELNVSRYDAFM
jgi:hypothetical protein